MPYFLFASFGTRHFIDKFLDRLLDDILPSLGDWVWKLVVKVADLILLAIQGVIGLIPGIGAAGVEIIQGVRDDMKKYWDNVLDTRTMNRKTERKVRELQEGLYDASGRLNFAGRGEIDAYQYTDEFLSTFERRQEDAQVAVDDFSDKLNAMDAGGFTGKANGISASMASVKKSTQNTSGRMGSFASAADNAASEMDGFSGSAGTFGKAAEKAADSLNGFSGISGSFAPIIEETADSLDGFSGSFGDFSKSFASMDGVSNAVSELGGDVDDFSGFVGSFGQTLDDSENSTDNFSGRMGEIFKPLEATHDETQNLTGTMGDFGLSLSDAASQAKGLSPEFEKLSKALGDVRQNSFASGQMWGNGYLSGMTSMIDEIRVGGQTAGEESVQALRESIDAHSPSRVTAGIGEMFAEGFTRSISESSNSAYWTGRQLGEASVNGLASPFSTLNSMVDGAFSFSPTITPILDMTNVNDGIRYLQNGFSANPSFGVNSTWTPNIKGYGELSSLASPTPNIDKIVEEMGYLRDDIVRMGEQLSKVQVYLDTGALVGEMSAPLDESLGRSTRRSIRSGRR